MVAVVLVLVVTASGVVGPTPVDASAEGIVTTLANDRTSPFVGSDGSVDRNLAFGVENGPLVDGPLVDGTLADADGELTVRGFGATTTVPEEALLGPVATPPTGETAGVSATDDSGAVDDSSATDRSGAVDDPGATDRPGATDAEAPTDGSSVFVVDGADRDEAELDPRSAATADADGDGLVNAREGELGTDPFTADTDGDGLTDGEEVALGTDPLSADTDGDRLVDSWEVRGATPGGAALPGSDPLVRDVYVQVDYAPGVSKRSPAFYDALEAEFAAMPVRNPDNSTGIALHVLEGGHLNETARFTGENFWRLKEGTYADRLGPRAGVYHQVVVTHFATDQVGYGEVGGRFALVAAEAPNATQRHVVVHELLHNVVGRVEVPGVCAGDPRHFCEGGYLSPRITPGEEAFLPRAVAAQIERDGLAE